MNEEEFRRRQLLWKESMKKILDDVGRGTPHQQYMNTYDKLVRSHKEIFKEEHDSYWLSGLSIRQLDTYLLVRMFSMLKHVMEQNRRNEE